MSKQVYLGVNIDHVATLRQARQAVYPEPIEAALLAERAGADGITLHLREDRRHIQDRDVRLLSEITQTRLNLEIAVTDAMIDLACEIKPAHCCLVPEKREEITTEGGLDVMRHLTSVTQAVSRLSDAGIRVSLFIDPNQTQIDAAKKTGAPDVELHTGEYANAASERKQNECLALLRDMAKYGVSRGLRVNAGHGLHYHNVVPVAAIAEIYELNIGHAIIARAVISGLHSAVADMRQLLDRARL